MDTVVQLDMLFAVIGAVVGIGLVLAVLIAIAEWKILTKAGEKGWKSLIPFYNIFISHEIVGMSHIWFIIEMVIWFIETILAAFVEFPKWFELPFLVFTIVFTVVSEIVHIKKMCGCFGKSKGFAVGLFFLPYVFLPIIAFGSAEYTPPTKNN